MTQPASSTHNEYIGNGGTTTFTYSFKILYSSDIEVRLNGTVQTNDVQYDLTGVGVATGGTVVFRTAPPSAAVVSIRMVNTYEQLLALTPNSALPAASLELQLDEIVRMIQVLDEQLSRAPQLALGIGSAWRDRFLPTPAALKLIGWDALGTSLAHYDPAIVQVTVSTSSHLAYGETQIAVPTVNTAVVLTATGVFPAGCIRIGALIRVTTSFGAAGGLTTFSAGDGTQEDRWGAGLARTATSAPTGANNPGMFRAFELKPIASAESVILTADAGTFDTVGAALVTGFYFTLAAA